jgi:hypothetical protein
MARTLSTAAVASANAQDTGEVWLVLLTITHETLLNPLRCVNNNEDISSRGLLFTAFPFQIILPSDDPDGVPRATLRIDNVSREALATIRSLNSPPHVTLEVILASQPDVVEIAYNFLTLRNATYDATLIEGELYFDSMFSDPITVTMTPSRFPGLF